MIPIPLRQMIDLIINLINEIHYHLREVNILPIYIHRKNLFHQSEQFKSFLWVSPLQCKVYDSEYLPSKFGVIILYMTHSLWWCQKSSVSRMVLTCSWQNLWNENTEDLIESTGVVTPQTPNDPKHEKDVSKYLLIFPFWQSNPHKSYQIPTSRIIIIIPLSILLK